jgi:hypothetical protein
MLEGEGLYPASVSLSSLTSMLSDYIHHYLCVFPPVPMTIYQLLNYLTDFLEIWYERYGRGGRHNVLLLSFVQSVMAWRT